MVRVGHPMSEASGIYPATTAMAVPAGARTCGWGLGRTPNTVAKGSGGCRTAPLASTQAGDPGSGGRVGIFVLEFGIHPAFPVLF